MTTIKRIFECIGDEIAYNLIKLGVVNPCHYGSLRAFERVCDSPFGGIIAVHLEYTIHILRQVCLLKREMHLLLIYFPHVKNLVYKS